VATDGDRALLADVAAALTAVRGAKSQAKVSMKTAVGRAAISGPEQSLIRLRAAEGDLRAVGHLVGEVTWTVGEGPLQVAVTLAETPEPRP
jgi:valyl-tRNA synthetase